MTKMEFDFEQNGSVTDIETVPEAYRGVYVEGQNDAGEKVYTISDAAKGVVEAYIGTNKSLIATRNDKKSASDESAARRQALKSFETLAQDFGLEVGEAGLVDAIKGHVDNLLEQVKGGKDLKINLDKIKEESERLLNEAVANEQAKTGKMQGALERYLVGQAAASAIADAKGSRELLLPIVQSKVKVVQDGEDFVVRVVDEQGDHRSDGKGGWMGVEALVAEMKTNERYARAFESEAPAGSGTPPGGPSQRAPRQGETLTPAQKIAAGIAKNQHRAA
jgi:hypothetical protein